MYKLRTIHVIVFISLSLTSSTFITSPSSTPLLLLYQFSLKPASNHLLALLLLVSDCLIYFSFLQQQKHSLYCVEKIIYSVRCWFRYLFSVHSAFFYSLCWWWWLCFFCTSPPNDVKFFCLSQPVIRVCVSWWCNKAIKYMKVNDDNQVCGRWNLAPAEWAMYPSYRWQDGKVCMFLLILFFLHFQTLHADQALFLSHLTAFISISDSLSNRSWRLI